MKINFRKIFTLSCVCLLLFSACKKEQKLNDEADVLSFSFNPISVLASKPVINDKNIIVQVVSGTDISKLNPVFTLSEGAVIVPDVNDVMDFTDPVQFTVISENKLIENIYTVTVVYPFESYLYSFQNWEANLIHPFADPEDEPLRGEQPVEINDNNESIGFWSSSNFGYGFLNDEDEKEDYPVRETIGVSGKGVSIVTRKGLAEYGAPIIAGSLFSGSFDVQMMLANPMGATHFGQPIAKEPIEIKGYYSYKSGEEFTDKEGNVISERKDKGIISAVFYEVNETFTHLDGTNLYTDAHIVSIGQFVFSDSEGDGYHKFSLKLDYAAHDKKPDFENKKYNLALIFSSSADGADFLGAINSELKIDEIEVFSK